MAVFQSAGSASFDGQSKVTLNLTANRNSSTGTPLVYSGTYSVQANCLGSINITSGDTVTFTMNVFLQGRTFALIGSDATYAYNGRPHMMPVYECLATQNSRPKITTGISAIMM